MSVTQPGARVETLEEVVAEQRVLRNPPVERRFEGVDVVDALADVAPFVEQVLIDVRHGGRVRVEADVAGEDLRERRARRALDADLHPRLQHAVAFGDPRGSCASNRGRLSGCDSVPTSRRPASIGSWVSESSVMTYLIDCSIDRSPCRTTKLVSVRAAQQPVELRELAALALPSHPLRSGWRSSGARGGTAEKRSGAMALVERVDLRARHRHQRVVLRRGRLSAHPAKSLSSAKWRCGSRLARNRTSRSWNSASIRDSESMIAGTTTIVRACAGMPFRSASFGSCRGRMTAVNSAVQQRDRQLADRQQHDRGRPATGRSWTSRAGAA